MDQVKNFEVLDLLKEKSLSEVVSWLVGIATKSKDKGISSNKDSIKWKVTTLHENSKTLQKSNLKERNNDWDSALQKLREENFQWPLKRQKQPTSSPHNPSPASTFETAVASEISRELVEREKETESLKGRLADCEQELADCKQELVDCKQELVEVTTERAKLDRKLGEVHQKLARLRSSESYYRNKDAGNKMKRMSGEADQSDQIPKKQRRSAEDQENINPTQNAQNKSTKCENCDYTENENCQLFEKVADLEDELRTVRGEREADKLIITYRPRGGVHPRST